MNIYQWKAPREETKTDHTYYRYNDDGTKQPAWSRKEKVTKGY
jgi:hypothetical protein